jgi:chromatin assembly factor 1 subunit B
MVFAVVTTTAILIYDTQHPHPLARIAGCHLATINDVAWSSNGQTLAFCSSDGYVTFVRLSPGVLGQYSLPSRPSSDPRPRCPYLPRQGAP